MTTDRLAAFQQASHAGDLYRAQRHDGEAAFELYLLADASRLLDDAERGALAQRLQAIDDQVGKVVIIFFDGLGEGLPPGTDEATVQGWLREFSLSRSDVRLHLVSSFTDQGRPVSGDVLAEAAAQFLAADWVLPLRQAPRPLSPSSRRAEASLSVLGVRGFYHDHELAVRQLGSLVRKRLAATRRKPESGDASGRSMIPFQPIHAAECIVRHWNEAAPTAQMQLGQLQTGADVSFTVAGGAIALVHQPLEAAAPKRGAMADWLADVQRRYLAMREEVEQLALISLDQATRTFAEDYGRAAAQSVAQRRVQVGRQAAEDLARQMSRRCWPSPN